MAISNRTAASQQPPGADTVSGRVTAEDSTPIAMADVRVKGENGREYTARTDSGGVYLVTIVGGTGAYEVSARAFGYVPLSVVVQREVSGGSRIRRDLQLNALAITLEKMKVVASRPNRATPAPADRSASWLSFLSEGLPVDPGDFGDLAALQPGVARSGTKGSDISIAGQPPDQNRTTVDGVSFSGTSLPAEGVRSGGVIANTYDVSRGQFSGGQLIATTISGTNLWGGALSARIENPPLHFGGLPAGSSSGEHSLRLSAGGGGPLVKDRLFVYGALDVSHARSTSFALDRLDPATLGRLELSPDSARRFLAIAKGLGLYSSATAMAGRPGSDFASLLARVDFTLSEHQSLTTRLDFRGSNLSGLGSSPFNLQGAENELRIRDGGVFAQLTSIWTDWSNELRVHQSAGSAGGNAGLPFPIGQVQVISLLHDGTFAPSVLGFGGRQSAQRQQHSLIEAADDLVRETESGAHRLQAGFLMQDQRASAPRIGNGYGTFSFNGLGDLEGGRPALYTRVPTELSGTAEREYAGAFLGDAWRVSRSLGLTYGLRLDSSHYGRRTAVSPAVASLATGADGQVPSELLVTPRLGFRYDLLDRRNWTIDGGVGEFGGAANIESLASSWRQTGGSESNLVCVGPAAPYPDWTRYAGDAGAIPSACAGGTSVFSSSVPPATVFDPHFGSPRTWRASLGAGGDLAPAWGVQLDGLLVHGTHLPSALDRNLVPSARFTLPEEGGRPVYAALGAVDPITGGIGSLASRRDVSLGPVRELGSRGESWTAQLTAGMNGFVAGKTLLSLSYTFTNSRLLQGGIPAPGIVEATTAGDPARLERTDAFFAPRHMVQLMATRSVGRRMRVAVIGRLSSGLPFTPLVAGDINGDGFANDRAFIFDPVTSADTLLGRDMARLRDAAPAGVSDCLRRQAGRIAAPGSCRTGWSPSVDFRAELFALGNINSRRLIVTLTASNITAAADYWLHGADNLRGWGQYPNPDATLLVVKSFNPVERAFKYAVNPRFGQPLGGGVLQVPFRIALQARITIGSDPRYQPLMNALQAGVGSSRQSIQTSLAERIHNIPAVVLKMAAADTATLELTLVQWAHLQVAADSLNPRLEEAVDSLTSSLMERGPMTAVRSARLQQRTDRIVSLVQLAYDQTRQILTPEQWAKLPEWLLRTPQENQLQRPATRVAVPWRSP